MAERRCNRRPHSRHGRRASRHVLRPGLFPCLYTTADSHLGLAGIASTRIWALLFFRGIPALLRTCLVQRGWYPVDASVQFFATSKDVSIGPVAVMSLTVAQIITSVHKAHPNQWTNPEIASTLAVITGFIVLGIGLLRIGWLVEFIPIPAVSGFMTGSAISIAAGQVPGLLGITGFE
jgi:hypothetical protein